MTSSYTVVVILLAIVTPLLACGSNQPYEYEDGDIDSNEDIVHIEENDDIEMLDDWDARNSSGIRYRDPLLNNLWHHGWTPPPSEIQQWRDWFDNYKTQFNQSVLDIVDPNNMHEFDEERGPGSGWPLRWADAGLGFGGAEPPPWAYAPKNTGKPRYCFLPPRIGVCYPPDDRDPANFTTPAPALRYAYHPYKDDCMPFNFSGCSGNRNNFLTKAKCEESCVAPIPFNGCDIESHIYIDDVVAANK